MYRYPEHIDELMNVLRRLPGVGRRAAERMALEFIGWEEEDLAALGTLIGNLPQTTGRCPECGNISPAGEKCAICADPTRDAALVCVVEDFTRIPAVEKSGMYHGLYHVLGGKLSPLEGRGAGELNIESLLKRLDAGGVNELIIMLSGDVEGRATANYLGELCGGKVRRISIPARGLPAGADPGYADAATIAMALKFRTGVE